MKTDPPSASPSDRSLEGGKKEAFQKLLRGRPPAPPGRAPPSPSPRPQPSSSPRRAAPHPTRAAPRLAQQVTQGRVAAADRSARGQKEIRAGHDATAKNLEVRRAEPDARAAFFEGARPERVLERLAQELQREERGPPGPAPLPVAGPGPQGSGEASPAAAPSSRVESALALVQRIEVWMKGSRPALTLGVGGALKAEVTVVRTGPGQISLSIKGDRGPPSSGEVRAVREALEQRGLKLTSVRIC